MLEKINSAGDKAFIWSDEKIFTVEPQINQQNARILADGPSGVDPAVRTANSRVGSGFGTFFPYWCIRPERDVCEVTSSDWAGLNW